MGKDEERSRTKKQEIKNVERGKYFKRLIQMKEEGNIGSW